MNTYVEPYTIEEIKKNYPKIADKLLQDPIHKWRAVTGIELIHKEPLGHELERIWNNWNLMTNEQKKISDKKSLEIFGMTNEDNYKMLKKFKTL
jgi:hypothetical protein